MHPIIIHGGPMGRWEVHARNHRNSQQRQAQPRTVGLSGLNLGERFTASRNRIPGNPRFQFRQEPLRSFANRFHTCSFPVPSLLSFRQHGRKEGQGAVREGQGREYQ